MPGSILGHPVQRSEDPELLVGAGTFIDNLRTPGLLHGVFVRSTAAHAHLLSVDVSEAAAMPGVRAVFTGATLGVPAHHSFVPLGDIFTRPPIAIDTVRFAGEAVALVIAETRSAAVDAAEAVVIDYDPLPAVADAETALGPDAPVIVAALGSNLAMGEGGAVEGDEFFGDADVIVRGRFVNQKVAAVPMEGNACAAFPDGDLGDGRTGLVVYASTQMPHAVAAGIAGVFGLEPGDVRVIAPHVGGGFGAKIGLYAEYTAIIGAARNLGQPVTWAETRSEGLVALAQSRAQVQYAELGVTRDGKMTGMRSRIVGDAGGYPGLGALLPGGTKLMSQGVYEIPAVSSSFAVAITNTTPTGAFRGAGRPEAAAMVERIVDMAAAELGIDPAEFRRKNFIASDAFPYVTKTGAPYDSGDYDLPLREALRLSGYDQLRAEQMARRASGDTKLLGIGLASYVEITAGGLGGEFSSIEIDTDGIATVKCGTSAHGQGHATAFGQLVSDRLGIPLANIRYVQSDTALVPRGNGTGGSRSLQVGGSAVFEAAGVVLDRAKNLAAALLEAAADDIVVTDDGRLGVAGVPTKALSWAELGAASATEADDSERRLFGAVDFADPGPSFPFGAHVAVVEVDRETGEVRLLRHIAVDDCGTVVNPLIVAGQQHGGIAQGVAQALFEEVVFDDAGNPRTSTLIDYLVPSAAEFPSFEVASTETPSPLNPLGAKGIGEAATIGSTPAVQNAVIDAVAHLGVRHIDMPLTPERVWRAIGAAEAGTLSSSWHEPPAVFATLAPPAAPTEVSAV